jgi:glycosyltransferase involved in cell wall biosynthesis
MASLTVLILTFNEEKHIERAIASIRSIAETVIVIDSYSTDRTVELAKKAGARILQNKFVTQSQQFRWALENSNVSSEWLLRLDADEYIMADLADEIVCRLPKLAHDITGVNLKRRHIFMGRWIRHGGRYPLLMLRLWRNGKVQMEQRLMDEHLLLIEGNAISFDGGFVDHNLNDISSFIEKHNGYTTREAVEVIARKYDLHFPIPAAFRGGAFQTKAKRFISDRLFNVLPFGIVSTAYFLYRYIILLGFFDGTEGLIYHFMQGYWYRFLIGAKVIEIESKFSPGDDRDAMRSKILALTGYQVAHGFGETPTTISGFPTDLGRGSSSDALPKIKGLKDG